MIIDWQSGLKANYDSYQSVRSALGNWIAKVTVSTLPALQFFFVIAIRQNMNLLLALRRSDSRNLSIKTRDDVKVST